MSAKCWVYVNRFINWHGFVLCWNGYPAILSGWLTMVTYAKYQSAKSRKNTILTTFSYLVNFQSFTKLPYFSRMMSDYNTDFLIAPEHHYVSFQPHHTCHIIILSMSLLPLSFLCLSLSLPYHHVFGYPFVIHWTPLTSMTITFNLYHILYKSLFFLVNYVQRGMYLYWLISVNLILLMFHECR